MNKLNDNEFLWDKNKFSNRYYGMQELYQTYLEGHKDWDVVKVSAFAAISHSVNLLDIHPFNSSFSLCRIETLSMNQAIPKF